MRFNVQYTRGSAVQSGAGVVGGKRLTPSKKGCVRFPSFEHRLLIGSLEFRILTVVRMKEESRQLNLVEQGNAWNFVRGRRIRILRGMLEIFLVISL